MGGPNSGECSGSSSIAGSTNSRITWQAKQTKTQANIQNRHECMLQYILKYNYSYCTIKIQVFMMLSRETFQKADMVGDSWILWVQTYDNLWVNLTEYTALSRINPTKKASDAAKDLRLDGAEVLIHRLWALETCSWQKQIQPETSKCR